MRTLILAAVLIFALPVHAAPAVMTGISLAKPIACTLGRDCLIQQYFDHDAESGASDYTCGTESYDGHDGTDFRLPDKMAQARGVAVLAAADGVVAALRDGEPDFDVGAFDENLVKGKECGNGVVLRHADGWETQYCHMRQGSVAVHVGQNVRTGDRLGLVGQSGDAAFVHLHLSVRHNGQKIDPFGPDAVCHAGANLKTSLWRPADRAELAWRDTQVLNIGFAARAVSMDDIERGGITMPRTQSPALVAYVRAISLHEGDVLSLVLSGPDGEMARQDTPPLDHDKAQYEMFVGKKLTTASWPAGDYRGAFTVTRNGRVILSRTVNGRL